MHDFVIIYTYISFWSDPSRNVNIPCVLKLLYSCRVVNFDVTI